MGMLLNNGMYRHECDICFNRSAWTLRTVSLEGAHSDWNHAPMGWSRFMEGKFRRDSCPSCSSKAEEIL